MASSISNLPKKYPPWLRVTQRQAGAERRGGSVTNQYGREWRLTQSVFPITKGG